MKFLLNKQNILNMNNGGLYEPLEFHKGGGGSQTTTSSTKTDPRLEQAAVDLLDSGRSAFLGPEGGESELGRVAGASGLQDTAFRAAGGAFGRAQADAGTIRGLANQGYAGSSADLATQAASNQAYGQAGATGNLGGSRNAINQGQIAAAGQAQYDQNRVGLFGQANQLEAGALGQLGQVGSAQRGIAQEQADSKAKALQQYSNVFAGAQGGFGKEQTSTSPKQGGK